MNTPLTVRVLAALSAAGLAVAIARPLGGCSGMTPAEQQALEAAIVAGAEGSCLAVATADPQAEPVCADLSQVAPAAIPSAVQLVQQLQASGVRLRRVAPRVDAGAPDAGHAALDYGPPCSRLAGR